jgi:hypothetical protein
MNAICNFDVNSILKAEWHITSSDWICFVIRKNATNSSLLYFQVSYRMTSVFFNFFDSGFEQYKFEWKQRYFLEKPLKEENFQCFFSFVFF